MEEGEVESRCVEDNEGEAYWSRVHTSTHAERWGINRCLHMIREHGGLGNYDVVIFCDNAVAVKETMGLCKTEAIIGDENRKMVHELRMGKRFENLW